MKLKLSIIAFLLISLFSMDAQVDQLKKGLKNQQKQKEKKQQQGKKKTPSYSGGGSGGYHSSSPSTSNPSCPNSGQTTTTTSSGSRSNSNSGSSGGLCGSGCIGFGVLAIIHNRAMDNLETYPHARSIEINPQFGKMLTTNEFSHSGRVRFNLGVYNPEIRVQTVRDWKNHLTTIDVQPLKFCIPANVARISLGVGYTTIPELDMFFPEFTADIELNFQKVVFFVGARTARDSHIAFRTEVEARAEARIYQFKRLNLNYVVGVQGHNYLGELNQVYVTTGVNARISLKRLFN